MEKQPNGPYVPEQEPNKERWVQDVVDFYLTEMDETKRDELKFFFRTVGQRMLQVYNYEANKNGEER